MRDSDETDDDASFSETIDGRRSSVISQTLPPRRTKSTLQERTRYIVYYFLEIHFTSLFIAAFAVLLVWFTARTAHRFYADGTQPRLHHFLWFNFGNVAADVCVMTLIVFLMWCLYDAAAFCLIKPVLIPGVIYLIAANTFKVVIQMNPDLNLQPFPMYTAVPTAYIVSGFVLTKRLKKAGYMSPVAEIRRVTLSILYTAIVFGFYSEWWMDWVWNWKSDSLKMLARVLVHPLIWETSLFTSRMAARQVKLARDENLIVIPAQICSALSGRILITSFESAGYSYATTIIVGLQGIFLQLTKKERDWLVCKFVYSKERRAQIFAEANPHLSWMTFNDHMILETSGIWTAPWMTFFYSVDNSLFKLLTEALFAFVIEAVADLAVIGITRYLKKPVVEIWYSLDRFRYFWVVWAINLAAVLFFLGMWRLLIQRVTNFTVDEIDFW